ncbi:hypothetical protein [Micromonospora sp. 4G55]|uniref:hypothetical protein n=1 Tax=Micromonospora sp. 4G55 TaxID=2806102 RepID=UPI001A38FBD4|nr:hypothetical protein [Micromonospora sp. 4G55]MBM0256652.1 hypothetical protein [Micromonospora sp. 4G55]
MSSILVAVLVVQRVRARWGAHARGATHAVRRRSVAEAYELPPLPAGETVVVHDVLADEAAGYRPASSVGSGVHALQAVGLHVDLTADHAVIERLPAGAAYPAWRTSYRLFTLQPGQYGRYLANFRFTGRTCAPRWYYEAWTVRVAFASPLPDLFLNAVADRDVDQRVHLYGVLPAVRQDNGQHDALTSDHLAEPRRFSPTGAPMTSHPRGRRTEQPAGALAEEERLRELRSGLARNPALPASLVEQLTARGEASVWLELADRDDLSGDQIRLLARRGDAQVVIRLLSRGLLSPDEVDRLDPPVVIASSAKPAESKARLSLP